MFTGKVLGSVVATRKDERLQGRKLLVVQPVDAAGAPVGQPLVAADTIGAGRGETVILVKSGDAARATGMAPCDAAIVGIIDQMGRPEGPQVDAAALGFRTTAATPDSSP